MGQRTKSLKELTELWRDEYEEYAQQQFEDEVEPSKIMDIWAWVASEEATAQEYKNEYLRIDVEE